MPSGAATATATLISTNANSNVVFISLQSSCDQSSNNRSMFPRLVVITTPAMECQVEVVGGHKAQRMKSRAMAGQSVGHHVGGAQVVEHGVQHGGGSVLLRYTLRLRLRLRLRQREIAPARGF